MQQLVLLVDSSCQETGELMQETHANWLALRADMKVATGLTTTLCVSEGIDPRMTVEVKRGEGGEICWVNHAHLIQCHAMGWIAGSIELHLIFWLLG